jgi:hypothetical protein
MHSINIKILEYCRMSLYPQDKVIAARALEDLTFKTGSLFNADLALSVTC